MAVLIVLFGALLLYRTLGALGLSLFATWISCVRYGLATMFAFIFTSVSHFAPMKKDLIAMVPPVLPRPDVIVLLTGIMELAAAAGLLFEATRFWAAWGLILLLIAMFPANVSAARRGVGIRGRPATPLWIRTPMQALMILWTWWAR
jgi:uncharacterized membrane protein